MKMDSKSFNLIIGQEAIALVIFCWQSKPNIYVGLFATDILISTNLKL